MSVALGIDSSLRSAGLVAIPFDWGLDWSRVQRLTIGEALPRNASVEDQVRRIKRTADGVRRFAREQGATHAWMEEYAFSSTGSRAHALGELGGLLKVVVVELGLPLAMVPPASARKLLGKMPRKGAKDHAHALLTSAGAPLSWTPDELDAFVTANWGLSGVKGADALVLEVEGPQRTTKRRKGPTT